MSVHSSVNMDDPDYQKSLTDPQAEIDAHIQAIRIICTKYKLPYFLVINHPHKTKDTWTTQMAAKIFKSEDAIGLFDTVDNLVHRASGGLLQVSPVDEAFDDFKKEKEDDDD